jgi:hypothetical protein
MRPALLMSDPAVLADRAIDEVLDLIVLGDVCQDSSFTPELKLFGERLHALKAACAEHEPGATVSETPCGGLPKPTACARDDDHFSFNAFGHDSFLF